MVFENYLEAIITNVQSDYLTVQVRVKKKPTIKEKTSPEKIAKWIEHVTKNYNPRTTWELSFTSPDIFTKEEIVIKCIDKSRLNQFYSNQKNTIWLERRSGERISAKNYTTNPNIYKTLRAYYHHEIKVIGLIHDRWDGTSSYDIEIGV